MIMWSFVSWRVALITVYNIASLGKCILPFKLGPSKCTFGTQSPCEAGTVFPMSIGPGQPHNQMTCGLRFL